MARWLTPGLLAIAVLVSAVVVVETKHHNRALVSELEQLRRERAQLDMEWSQLQLEEATLSHPSMIERTARERLQMDEPARTVQVRQAP